VNVSADNFRFDLSCAPLDESLAIAFRGAAGGKATHWRADTDPVRLVLAWHDTPGFTPLPVPLDAEGAAVFVKAWLAAAEYGPEFDHDGDNGKSWRIYNESWGHVDGCHYAFVAIEPLWAMYGK
jgi:hypothetical protein